jgi:hypothetical protein
MTLLDVAGSGLFSNSAPLFHALGEVAKLAAGSFLILLLAFTSFVSATIYALYRAYQTSSVLGAARTFVQAVAYVIGISVALAFVMVSAMFFSVATIKLLFIAVLITFVVAFVVRETFLFLILKRFGKYVMYFTALRYIKENVYTNGQQQNQDPNGQ